MQLYPDWSSRANTNRTKKRKRKQDTNSDPGGTHMPHSTHSYNPLVIRKEPPAPSTLFIITYILLYYIIHSYIATLYYVACFLPVLGVLGRYLYYILYIYIHIYLIMTIILLYKHAYTFIYTHIYMYIYINVTLLYIYGLLH